MRTHPYPNDCRIMHSCPGSLFHPNQFPLPFPIHFLNTLIQVYMILLVHVMTTSSSPQLENVIKEHLIRLSKLWKLRPISHINVAMDQLSFPDTWRRHLVPSFNMLVVMTRVIVSCLFVCLFVDLVLARCMASVWLGQNYHGMLR